MVVKLSSQKLLKTLYSLKTITKLLILSSILLIGMDIINSYLLNDLEEPPQEIDGGEIKEQIIVIGRGQVLTIKAWSRYTLRLIITSDHATSRKNGLYQEYSVTENSLYDHSGSQFSYRFNASNYTIILLYWNNSILVDTTTPNQIEAHFTISGLDYDVIIVSSLFIILAIFFEILSKLIGRITKKETFLNKQDYSQILSYDYNNSLSETRLKFPSRFRKVFLLGKREMTNFPTYTLFVMLLISFLIVNPTKKLIIFLPQPKRLAISLLSGWIFSLQELLVLLSGILVLIGVEIWRSRLETGIFQFDASLPIKRTTYVNVILFLLSIGCSFVLLIPFLVTVLINFFRFAEIPELYIITIFLFWLITWELFILIDSGSISLLFYRVSSYTIIVLVFGSIIILITVVEIIFPKILFPIPNRLPILVTLITSDSLSINHVSSLLFESFFLLLGITFLFNLAIKRIQVE